MSSQKPPRRGAKPTTHNRDQPARPGRPSASPTRRPAEDSRPSRPPAGRPARPKATPPSDTGKPPTRSSSRPTRSDGDSRSDTGKPTTRPSGRPARSDGGKPPTRPARPAVAKDGGKPVSQLGNQPARPAEKEWVGRQTAQPVRPSPATRPPVKRAQAEAPTPASPAPDASAPTPVLRRRAAPRPPVGDSSRPLYLVQTQPGIGSLAWNEIDSALRKASLLAQRHIPQKDDVLLLQTASPVKELLDLRTIEDVFVVAARAFNIAATMNGLKQIHATVKSSSIVAAALQTYTAAGRRLPKNTRFRIVARATGRQEYTRKAVGEAVADAIVDGWPGKWRFEDNEEIAEIEIWVTLFATELVVALRLSDATMRHRGTTGGREVNRPAALRPVIAAAMVQLTNPQPNDVFLDPMAGTGTLIAERANLAAFDRLIAGDKNRDAVKAMTKNLQHIGGDLAIRRLDATDLPFADGEINKIACNLPFGKQVNHPDELNVLYSEIFREWVRVVKPGGTIVVLASDLEPVRTALSRAPELRIRSKFSVNVLGQSAMILQIERRG